MSEDTKEKRRRSMWVSITAIAGIVILESIAMLKGLNGVTFSLAIMGIAGAAGFTVKTFLFPK